MHGHLIPPGPLVATTLDKSSKRKVNELIKTINMKLHFLCYDLDFDNECLTMILPTKLKSSV